MFTKFQGVPPDRLDEVIDGFTEADWDHIERGYLDVVGQQLHDWWKPDLGLVAGVDELGLLCNLYSRSLARTPGA